MKQLKGEKGITLIEMLATMVILFIIGSMFYAVLTQTFTNFHTSEEKITARQEANLIIAHFTNIHQKGEKYKIEYIPSDNSFFTTDMNDSGVKMKLGHKDYTYKLKVGNTPVKSLDSLNSEIEVDLKVESNKNQTFELTLKSKNNDRNDTFTIKTTISRMTVVK